MDLKYAYLAISNDAGSSQWAILEFYLEMTYLPSWTPRRSSRKCSEEGGLRKLDIEGMSRVENVKRFGIRECIHLGTLVVGIGCAVRAIVIRSFEPEVRSTKRGMDY